MSGDNNDDIHGSSSPGKFGAVVSAVLYTEGSKEREMRSNEPPLPISSIGKVPLIRSSQKTSIIMAALLSPGCTEVPVEETYWLVGGLGEESPRPLSLSTLDA